MSHQHGSERATRTTAHPTAQHEATLPRKLIAEFVVFVAGPFIGALVAAALAALLRPSINEDERTAAQGERWA